MLVFDWIAGSFQVKFCKQGRVVRKRVDAKPRLKINWLIFFLDTSVSYYFCFVYLDQTQNRRSNNIQKTSLQSYNIFAYPGLA